MLQIGTLQGDQYVIDARDYDLSLLRPLLEHPDITFVGHNIKFDYNMLKNYNIVLNKVYDTMVMEQMLYNGKYDSKKNIKGRYSLKGVYKHYFKEEIEKDVRDEFLTVGDRNFTERQFLYGANDVVYPLQIMKEQEKLIEKYDLEKTKRLENAFVLALGDMEYNGFKVDIEHLRTIISQFKENKVKSIQDLDEYLLSKNPRFKKQANQLSLFGDHDTRLTDVNWNSDQQVYDILKNTFGITPVDKYGKESAGKDALEQLDEEFYDPIIAKLLKYRQEEKIITSFGESFIRKHLKSDGRLHSSFNQIVSTGRISSRDPNLQQIPSKNKEYRKCFVAGPGNLLSCADYSGQEARIMADFANDEAYIHFFNVDGKDSHSFVATKMFSAAFHKEFIVTADNENKEYRQKGKTLNFGISFGMSEYTLSKRLHISVEEAKSLIDLFYNTFPGLRTLFNNARAFGMKHGYIRTNDIIKRIRWFADWETLPELRDDKSAYAKAKGKIERRAQNTIIQGSAGDMTKIAFVLMRKKLLEQGIRPLRDAKIKIILAIHDESIVEASEDMIEVASKIQKESMEQAGSLLCKKVQIKAEPQVASYWKH